jgi:HlyD family secretion protein
MNKRILITFTALGIAAFWLLGAFAESSDKKLIMSGNFEVDDVTLSFRVPGLLEKRFVNEGDTVASGCLVARLDDEEYRLATEKAQAAWQAEKACLQELLAGSRKEEKEQAAAQLQMAQAMLQQLVIGLRPQEIKAARAALQQAEALVNKARAALSEAEKDETRFTRLFENNAISEKDYLSAKTRADTARASYNEAIARQEASSQQLSIASEGTRKEEISRAQAAVCAASATLDLIIAGPRNEKIDQASARASMAELAFKQSQLACNHTRLLSPVSGTVIAKAAEAGEFVRQGQTIVSIADLQSIYLRAYISESRLGLVKIGQQVKIKTDSYPDEVFEGKLMYISQEAEFTPKSVQTHEERVKLVYRLKIAVRNPQQKLKPGMPADAVIEL